MLVCLNIQNLYVFYLYIIAVMFLFFYSFILVILFLFCVYIDLLRCVMYMILICVYFTMYWVRDDLINEFNHVKIFLHYLAHMFPRSMANIHIYRHGCFDQQYYDLSPVTQNLDTPKPMPREAMINWYLWQSVFSPCLHAIMNISPKHFDFNTKRCIYVSLGLNESIRHHSIHKCLNAANWYWSTDLSFLNTWDR